MLRLVVDVDSDNPEGVKECLAMMLEEFGDVRVVEVIEQVCYSVRERKPRS